MYLTLYVMHYTYKNICLSVEGMVDTYCIFLHRSLPGQKETWRQSIGFQKWQLANHINEKIHLVWGSRAQQPLWVLCHTYLAPLGAPWAVPLQLHPDLRRVQLCLLALPVCAPVAALGSFAVPNKHPRYSVISTNFPKALSCLFLLGKSCPYLSLLIVPATE